MKTFVQGPMRDEQRAHTEDQCDQVHRAYYKYATSAENNIKQAQVVSFALQNSMKTASEDLEYLDPTPWPLVFDECKAIPAIMDMTPIPNISTLAHQLGAGAPDDEDIFKTFINIFFDTLSVMQDAARILPTLSFQLCATCSRMVAMR